MPTRPLTIALALLIGLLVLLLVGSLMIPALQRWRTVMISFGLVVAAASFGLMIVLLLSHQRSQARHDEEAETAFEREILGDVGSVSRTRVAVPSAVESPADEPISLSGPTSAAPQLPPSSEGLPGLLSQLRLARLDPAVEGQIQLGPLAGAVLLRLAKGETALVLKEMPPPEEWASLFPRYDRVFLPQAGGRWLVAERLEALVTRGVDLS